MRPFLCFSSNHSWKRISNFRLVSVYWCHLAVYIFAINLSLIRVGRTYFNEDLSTTQIHGTGVINHHRSTNIMFAGRKCRSVFWSFSSWYAQWNINERFLYHKNTMWFSIRWMFPYIYIYIYIPFGHLSDEFRLIPYGCEKIWLDDICLNKNTSWIKHLI